MLVAYAAEKKNNRVAQDLRLGRMRVDIDIAGLNETFY